MGASRRYASGRLFRSSAIAAFPPGTASKPLLHHLALKAKQGSGHIFCCQLMKNGF